MKTFDEAVQWAKGKHAEAQKITDKYVPTHVNKRKPVTPTPGKPEKPNGKSTT
jgi:hypothetical protein